MAVDAAKSTSTTVTEAIKNRYYDELFLKTAEAQLVHKQMGQRNKKIEKGQGGYGTGVVYWTRMANLPLVSAGQGEGTPTTAVSLTAINVTGSTAQYDAAVSISDILAYTSMGDIMKQAMERLAYNAGLSIDTIIRNVIATGMTLQYQGGASHWTAVPSTATLDIGGIRKATRTLARNNAVKPDGGFWISVLHTDQVYDLQGDTTTGGWIDANKYTDGNAMKLMNGEVGKLMGVRFLETSNGYVRGTGVATSASVYVATFTGKEAYGVTDLQNLKTYIKGFSSGGTGDPTEKVATAGWKCTFGATVLDSTFGVNLHTAVSSTA